MRRQAACQVQLRDRQPLMLTDDVTFECRGKDYGDISRDSRHRAKLRTSGAVDHFVNRDAVLIELRYRGRTGVTH